MQRLKRWAVLALLFALAVSAGLNVQKYIWAPVQRRIYNQGVNDAVAAVIQKARNEKVITLRDTQGTIILMVKDPNEVQ